MSFRGGVVSRLTGAHQGARSALKWKRRTNEESHYVENDSREGVTPFTQHLEMTFRRQYTLVAAGVSSGGRFAGRGREVMHL